MCTVSRSIDVRSVDGRRVHLVGAQSLARGGLIMDFELPTEDDPRRVVVRRWCEEHPHPTGMELAKSGYTAPHWPPPYGLDADPMFQLIIEQELERAGIKRPHLADVVIHNIGIMLLTHGTDEQKERLWPGLAGEEFWSLGYSEPEAGSDLGGLRTQAKRDGDTYVVNGSKIWTSGAHFAKFAFVLVRTDPSAPKHRGLSLLLIDMKNTPGIEVKPIHDMSGAETEYNEISFTDAHVPVASLVGREGDGWRLAMGQLQTERVAISIPRGEAPWRALVDGLNEIGALDDEDVLQRAATLYVEGEAQRLLAYRDLSNRMHGRTPGPEGSLIKLLGSPHQQRVTAMVMETMGADGLLEDAHPFAVHEEAHQLWFAPALTLMVGTTEIQKNIIAERVLDLPRDKDPSALLPWNDPTGRGSAS
jgi:alkylation response protein AidB-like acyl-CoA dehydrogenase